MASDPASLVERNLQRGWRLGLPSGQAVAKAMHLTPLKDSEILIGKAVDVQDPGVTPTPIAQIAGGAFKKNCPLWTYILAEAARNKTPVNVPVSGPTLSVTTPQLGPVGGRIVAEVILGLMFGDPSSILSLDPLWDPVDGAGLRAQGHRGLRPRGRAGAALGQGRRPSPPSPRCPSPRSARRPAGRPRR